MCPFLLQGIHCHTTKVQFPWHVLWQLMLQAWRKKFYTWFSPRMLSIIWVVLANVWGHNFHLLESLVCRDSQSAWMFWELGRYSAVTVILFSIKFRNFVEFRALCSSHFHQVRQGCDVDLLVNWFWFSPCKATLSPIWLLSFLKHLCGVVLPPCSTDPLL